MTAKTLEQVILEMDKEIAQITQDSETILKLEAMIDQIITERDTNISKAIGSIKETITRSDNVEINIDDPLSINLKKAIDTRNITAESSEREINKRGIKIKQKIEAFKMSLRFLHNVIGKEAIGLYNQKLESIEDRLIDII